MNDILHFIGTHVELVVGWLLGVISPLSIILLNRWTDKRRFLGGVSAELAKIRSDIVARLWIIATMRGEINKTFIHWYENQLQYIHEDDIRHAVKSIVQNLSQRPESHWDLFLREHMNTPDMYIAHRKLQCILIDHIISTTTSFRHNRTVHLLDILEQINLYNNSVEEHAKFSDMTFDSTKEGSMENIRKNIDSRDNQIVFTSHRLIDLISDFLK